MGAMDSSQSTVPFFGRAFQISIQSKTNGLIELSQSGWTPEALRVQFHVEQVAMQAYWFADVTIWNLNQSQQQALLMGGVPATSTPAGGTNWTFNDKIIQGDAISISAGYQYNFDPANNLLFQGAVFQPMWTRENVVDWKITLRCLIGLIEDANQVVSFPIGPISTQMDVVAQLCEQAHINQENIDTATLRKKQFPRGQAIHGKPLSVLRDIAKDNNLLMWISPHGLNMRSLEFSQNVTPDIVYAPPVVPGTSTPLTGTNSKVKYTLIGVPRQTQEGVEFTVLMDAEPKMGSIVQLQSGTAINQLPRTIGTYPAILSQNLTYVVAGIRHRGDTRGNEWYTDITGFTWNFWELLAASNQP